jgi:hypothetical protein
MPKSMTGRIIGIMMKKMGPSKLAGSPGFLARMQYQDSVGNMADRAAAQWFGQRL